MQLVHSAVERLHPGIIGGFPLFIQEHLIDRIPPGIVRGGFHDREEKIGKGFHRACSARFQDIGRAALSRLLRVQDFRHAAVCRFGRHFLSFIMLDQHIQIPVGETDVLFPHPCIICGKRPFLLFQLRILLHGNVKSHVRPCLRIVDKRQRITAERLPQRRPVLLVRL